MSVWSIHIPDDRGLLDRFLPAIEDALESAEGRLAEVVEPFALDIFVEPATQNVIPELGFGGYAPGPGKIFFSFDAENPNLRDNLGAPLERMIAHEFHHALRWYGAGYGRTLIEALVSEGLAGRFVQEVFRSDAEPWERAVRKNSLPEYARKALREGDTLRYDHAAWFFGRGDLPRWVGYSLGWELVGHYLRRHADARPSGMATITAGDFLPPLRAMAERERP